MASELPRETPAWAHPHDAFREGMALLYRALSRREGDVGGLLLGLWAYVEALVDEDNGHRFSQEWNDLQDEWEQRGSRSGVGMGMSPEEFDARRIVLIVRYAKQAGIFEAADDAYTINKLDRQVERMTRRPKE